MKVVCINTGHPGQYAPDEIPCKVKEGQVYEVVDSEYEGGYEWYELSFDIGTWYIAEMFIPLSDIDETELVNEREEYLV